MKPENPLTEKTATMAAHSAMEPILAGILCLMSSWASQPDPQVAGKIIRNLEDIMTNANTSANFRIVCARLRDQWLTNLADTAAYQPTLGQYEAGKPIH